MDWLTLKWQLSLLEGCCTFSVHIRDSSIEWILDGILPCTFIHIHYLWKYWVIKSTSPCACTVWQIWHYVELSSNTFVLLLCTKIVVNELIAYPLWSLLEMFRWNNSVFACTLMWFVLCQSPNSLGILVQNRWSPCIGLHLKDKLTIDKRRSLYLCPTGKLTVDRRTLCEYPQDKLIVDKRSSCFFRLTLSETPNALLEKNDLF